MVVFKNMSLLDTYTDTIDSRTNTYLLKGNYRTNYKKMGPQENNANSKEREFKVKMDQVEPQKQYLYKKMTFTHQTKLTGAFGPLIGQTFSVHRIDDFKYTLDNIIIYVGSTYGHDAGMMLRPRKRPPSHSQTTSKTILQIPPSTSGISSALITLLVEIN